jgi:hypothetical protein
LVTVEFDSQDDGGTRVSVRTASWLPLWLFDWGQGAKDIRLIREALSRSVR